jgi:hypothetical protein
MGILDSIFDFAGSSKGLVSILAAIAGAKDRERDRPPTGGGVSYAMPGPRRLQAVKNLGRYTDVMGLANGGAADADEAGADSAAPPAADPPPLRLHPLPPRSDEPPAPPPPEAAAAAPSPPAVVVPLKTAASLEPARTVAALPPAAETRDREPAPRPGAVSERPAQTDADATLARFMTCYERGDTQALMALFDDVAIGPAGGKTQIRREHESLFKSTSLRHLAIERINWKREGDWVRGEGRYHATQMRKGEQWLRTETGTIRIELLQRSGRALIMGLDYQPGERS